MNCLLYICKNVSLCENLCGCVSQVVSMNARLHLILVMKNVILFCNVTQTYAYKHMYINNAHANTSTQITFPL